MDDKYREQFRGNDLKNLVFLKQIRFKFYC